MEEQASVHTQSSTNGGDESGSRALGLSGSPAFSLVRSAGRDPATVAFERQVVDFFIEASEILGAPKSVAAIYGMIFASPAPIGFLELQRRLDISAGSISQGLKALKAFGAVKLAASDDFMRAGSAGSSEVEASATCGRRDLYVPNLAGRDLLNAWLNQKLQMQIASGKAQLDAIMNSVPAANADGQKKLALRVTQLRRIHQKAEAVVPVIKAIVGI